MSVKLHVYPAGPIMTNAYLLTEPGRGEALLVDAPDGIADLIAPVLQQEKCRLAELWLTHGHWDHTQGGADVVRRTGAKVRGHEADRMLFEQPKIMAEFMGEELDLPPLRVDHWLTPGEQLAILGTTAEVRHVPGHCPGNVLFYFAAYAFAIVGDALFNGSVGRTDLPGGDADQLARSIREQIYTLPDDTVVFPGHGPKTTVGDEKENNPYVSG